MRRVFALVTAVFLLAAALPALGDEGTSFTMAGCDTSDAGRDWNTHLFFTRMAEETEVRFTAFNQFSSVASFSAWKMSLRPDSEDLPDVLFKAVLSDEETRTLYERGVLIDLRPYINEETMPNLYGLFQNHPDWRAACALPDGAIVALPSIDPIQSNNLLWVNRSWLTRTGQRMPTTAAELTEVLRGFKTKDANGNGSASDEIPLTFTGMWDLRWLLHAYGIMMNDYSLTTDSEGRVSTPLYTDEMREAIAWLHDLWDESLLDHNGFTSAESLRRLTDEKNITYGMLFGPTVTSLLPSGQVSEYEAVIPLTYDGQQVYRSLLGEVTRGTFAVTCHCSDPAAVLRWVDYLYSEEGCYLARAGKEGEEYTVAGDGTWRWTVSEDQLTAKVYRTAAITDDLPIPGYIPVEYQLKYDDATIQRQVEQNQAVAAIAREACPQVFFTRGEAARLAELWSGLGVTIEYQLTWFVSGDDPLTDETWEAFIASLREQGMDEVVAIWQTAVDRYEEAKQ